MRVTRLSHACQMRAVVSTGTNLHEGPKMNRISIALPLTALLAACGSSTGGSSSGGSSGDIRIVGSSTVYPFTTSVAEDFMRANPGVRVTVESTGTGSGMKLFCAGVGNQFPDATDASRPMKKSEYEACAKAGTKTIIEVPIGIDGLTIIEAANGPAMNLTQADIYKALAANPFGKGPNKAQTWKDVNPSLPRRENPRAWPAADFGHARQPGRSLFDQ